MMSWISVLAAVAALQAPTAAAPGDGASGGSAIAAAEADWARRPSLADLARFYPEAATKGAVSGDVTLVCRVDRQGALSSCDIAAETPAGYGFGQAALKIAQSYGMRPERAARWATGDRRVLLPVAFRPPGARVSPPSDEWVARPYRLRRLPRPDKT